MRYDYKTNDYQSAWEEKYFQYYDILVNTEIISIDSVEKMFWINQD